MEKQETKTPERKPLLELSTLAPERPLAVIDDIPHEFRLMQDFGAIEHQEFSRDSRRYDTLWREGVEGRKLKPAEKKELVALLERLFDRVMVDAAALRAQLGEKLTGTLKREFVLTFTNAPLLMAAMAQQTTSEAAAGDSSTTES